MTMQDLIDFGCTKVEEEFLDLPWCHVKITAPKRISNEDIAKFIYTNMSMFHLVHLRSGNADTIVENHFNQKVLIRFSRYFTDEIADLQNQIHTALIELCALADAEDKVLDLNIETHYLNSAGKVQCNAVLACDVKFIDKGEL